jgi:hypothetical protein
VNGDSFVAEKPRAWIAKLAGPPFDLAPDGKRMAAEVEAPGPPADHEVVLLENFSDYLRRLAPTGK